ncbi:MAG: hypothetical protein V4492_08535 [Chlamydiota bacterium]
MNILPLILAFLLVFGGIALTFLRDSKSFWIMESTLSSVKAAQNAVNNRLAQRAYIAHQGEPLVKRGEQAPRALGNFRSRRAMFPPLEESKWNLGPLFVHEGPSQLHPFYEPLARHLRLLYQKNLFSAHGHPDKIEYQIIDAVLSKGHALKDVHSFSELFPDNPKLQKLFYHMLKGTTQHGDQKGYPPFADCFSLLGERTPICLSFAAPQILEALFDKETMEFILEEERIKWASEKKYVSITKEELQNHLATNPQRASILASLESYLSYSNQPAPRKIIRGKDPRTGIIAQKELSQ